VLSVPLRYTESDYPYGIFKLFLMVLTSIKNGLYLHTFSNALDLYSARSLQQHSACRHVTWTHYSNSEPIGRYSLNLCA
jgi:hypothetical protein